MPDSLLTQCPHCQTAFRITQEHLQIAGGAVRCGACYQVFHAGENIINPVVDSTPSPTETPVSRPAIRQNDPGVSAVGDDDFELDDFDDIEDIPAAPAEPSRGNTNRAPAGTTSLSLSTEDDFDDDAFVASLSADFETAPPPPPAPGKKKSSVDSEDWAKALLMELGEAIDDEDDEPSHVARPAKPVGPVRATTAAPAAAAEPPTFASIAPDDNALSPFDDTPPRAPALLDDDLSDSFKAVEPNAGRQDPFKAAGHEPLETDTDAWAHDLTADLTAPEPEAEVQGSSPVATTAPAPGGTNTLSDDDFLSQFDEDLDIDISRMKPSPGPFAIEDITMSDVQNAYHSLELMPDEPSRKGSKKPKAEPTASLLPTTRSSSEKHAGLSTPRSLKPLWIGGSAALVLLAMTLLGYLYFDQWARHPLGRPVYATVCKVTGCKLPSQTDTSRIHTNKLVVRTHPTRPNTLAVDTLMVNEASYAQAFPLLELTFEDVNGNLVSRNVFPPQQYLRDPGIDVRNMPARTPFHVGLEIQDPGQGAVNYHLRFLPVPD